MPRPKDPLLTDARRATILKIAAGEFAEKGYRGASLNRILRRAGVSKGVAYHYFDGKADLFAALLESVWSRWISFVGPPPRVGNAAQFWEACATMCRRNLEFFVEEPATAALVRTIADGAHSATIKKLRDEMRQWGRAFLRHGQSIGAIRDDLPEPLLLDLMVCASDAIDLWCAENLQHYRSPELMELARRFVRLYRRLAEPHKDDEDWRSLWDKAKKK